MKITIHAIDVWEFDELTDAISDVRRATLDRISRSSRPTVENNAVVTPEVLAEEEAAAVRIEAAIERQETLKEKLQAFVKKNGLPAAQQLLEKHGAKRVGDLSGEQTPAFILAVEAGIAA